MRGLLLFVAVASSVLVAGVLAVGCGEYIGDWGRNCTAEELAEFGCGYCPVTCSRLDGGVDAAPGEDAGGTCEGECAPTVPVNWFGPLLLWTGPGSEMPACPSQAPEESGYLWHGDLQVPPASCGACSCQPPVGSCTLPTILTASSSICADSPGTFTTLFDAPPGWSGACTSANAIEAGEVCGSAASPCVKSITLAPLTVTQGLCMPVMVADPKLPDPAIWGIAGKVCRGSPLGRCSSHQEHCIPASAPGFKRCVYKEGDKACADMTEYTDRYVLYTDLSDTRGCTLCSCGEPAGGSCSSFVSLFKDDVCGVPIPAVIAIDALEPKCHDLPPGVALGSKSAGSVTFAPGVCQPTGGGPTGSVEPLNPTTYCCLPDP